jgi:DNA-binding transcriptional ArsR family regulator
MNLRDAILNELAQGPGTVGDIADRMRERLEGALRVQLKNLRNHGQVTRDRGGPHRAHIYSLRTPP